MVQRVKDIWEAGADIPVKVGHGGTLDPLATGVMVIGVGSGTKLLHQKLGKTRKSYSATAKLGEGTNTLDNDPTNSEVISTAPWEHVDLNLLQTIAAEQFHGSIEQTPPLFSAIRLDGKRLYDRARKDGATLDDVTIKPRIVHVHHVGINSVGADAIVDEQLDLPYF
eukprot:gene24586-569_t